MRRQAGEDGAVAVEFALLLPLLLALIFGIIEFGFIFNTQIALTQAAREGVRVEALRTDDYTGPDGGDVAEASFLAANAGGSEPVGNVEASCEDGVERAHVSITIDEYTPFLLGLVMGDISLSGEAVMRCGG